MNKITFEEWMKKVDVAVESIAGCSVHDLPDFCFRDAYDDGRNPASVARETLVEAGF
jgi:hypothetical protein